MQLTQLAPGVREVASRLPFRQSMLHDYVTCPQMSLYRWLFSFEEESTFFSAVMGSAGHKVIYDLHEDREFNLGYPQMLSAFEYAFDQQLDREKTLPKLGVKFDNFTQQRDHLAPMYTQMLLGYQGHARNKDFYSTMHEQSFVLEVTEEIETYADEEGQPVLAKVDEKPFIFTGQIDQGGFYGDGTFVLRDIKFRESTFRPSKVELDLNMQLSIYAYAMRFGKPACEGCKPQFNEFTSEYEYAGPCNACAAKIGTNAWPQKYPERTEMIWMRDFLKYEKDQFAKTVKDKTRKMKNPRTGRMVIAEVLNPKYDSGYKKGDFKGPGFMVSARAPNFLQVHMSDIIRICKQMREGVFYRKPGGHCLFWCKHRETCMNALELEMDAANVGAESNFATLDPFGD